ncbi:MAG: ferredoxin [Acidimicrobiales bacterium]
MRVTVDDERCRGHAICCTISDEVFTLTDDGYSVAIEGEIPPELEEAVRTAVSRCPERAITIDD